MCTLSATTGYPGMRPNLKLTKECQLRAEIDKMIASGEISESLTFSDTQKMPYLQAVIKEAIRVHPAAGLPLQRVVPKGGVKLAGQFFPEGVSTS